MKKDNFRIFLTMTDEDFTHRLRFEDSHESLALAKAIKHLSDVKKENLIKSWSLSNSPKERTKTIDYDLIED